MFEKKPYRTCTCPSTSKKYLFILFCLLKYQLPYFSIIVVDKQISFLFMMYACYFHILGHICNRNVIHTFHSVVSIALLFSKLPIPSYAMEVGISEYVFPSGKEYNDVIYLFYLFHRSHIEFSCGGRNRFLSFLNE